MFYTQITFYNLKNIIIYSIISFEFMKAIKIPNTALLDVFGRPVAIDSHDLHRPSVIPNPSYTGTVDKPTGNNHYEAHNKLSTATSSIPNPENPERLTVIG